MAVIVTLFEAPVLTLSEKRTENMLLRTPNQALQTSPLAIEAEEQRYRQAMQVLYLCGRVVANADILPEITRRIRLAWVCSIGSNGNCMIWRMHRSLQKGAY